MLSLDRLRECVRTAHRPDSNACILDSARLLAAYYLGWPLLQSTATPLPTLFQWSEIKQDNVPSSFTVLDRTQFAAHLVEQFSPKVPLLLLWRLSHRLEAVLYSDHFADRRTALVTRMAVDEMFGLSLSTDYCECLVNEALPRLVEATASGERAGAPLSSRSLDFTPLIRGFLELDALMSTRLLRRVEAAAVERIELLFARLPLQVGDDVQLPRVPVYCTPDSPQPNSESTTITELHCWIKILLTSLHQSNRLERELDQLTVCLGRFNFCPFAVPSSSSLPSPYSGCLLRVLLTVLRVVYRDMFSAANRGEWDELPEIAAKYQALLSADDDDTEAFERWSMLVEDSDVKHTDLFFSFLRDNFRQTSNLPPLSTVTKEVWLDHLLSSQPRSGAASADAADDWMEGLMVVTDKLSPSTLSTMQHICTHWSVPPLPDPTLVPLRLGLKPRQLASMGPAPPEGSPRAQTARLPQRSHTPMETVVPDRRDIIGEYARRGEARASFTHAWRQRLEEFGHSQRKIQKQVDDESAFITGVGRGEKLEERWNGAHTDKTRRPSRPQTDRVFTPRRAQRQLEEIIRDDLNRLNEKLDKVARYLPGGSVGTSSLSSNVESDEEREDTRELRDSLPVLPRSVSTYSNQSRRLDRSQSLANFRPPSEPLEVEELDAEPVFDYEEVLNSARDIPEIGRLDFSALTPQPNITQPKHSVPSPPATLPRWMRLIPLESKGPLPLLQRPRRNSAVHTERAMQTSLSSARRLSECRGTASEGAATPARRIEIVRPLAEQHATRLLNQ